VQERRSIVKGIFHRGHLVKGGKGKLGAEGAWLDGAPNWDLFSRNVRDYVGKEIRTRGGRL